MSSTLYSRWTQTFPPAPTFTDDNVEPQNGRVFIVTGGNKGLGFELCKLLHGTGATVYVAARSKERAEKAISDIVSTGSPKNPATFKFLPLDLSDLRSVKAAATQFAQLESRLDVLWNNAGIGARNIPAQSKTAQGLEMFMGVHCVAPLLFTQLLLPQLRAAVAASTPGATRVVWTSSAMVDTHMPKNGIDFDVLETGISNGDVNYARSKCGNWVLSHEFAKRYGKDGIVSVVQNPGGLKTDSFEGVKGLTRLLITPLLHEPRLGGCTELYAGLSPEITLKCNGAYIIPFGRIRPTESLIRQDIVQALKSHSDGGADLGGRFWKWCEDQARAGGYKAEE